VRRASYLYHDEEGPYRPCPSSPIDFLPKTPQASGSGAISTYPSSPGPGLRFHSIVDFLTLVGRPLVASATMGPIAWLLPFLPPLAVFEGSHDLVIA